jgi:hypothetical protein
MISDSLPFAVLQYAKSGLYSSVATVVKSSPSRNGYGLKFFGAWRRPFHVR